jgi:hypothetical protein
MILGHTFSHYDESQDRRKVNLLMKLDSVSSHELLQHIYTESRIDLPSAI